MPMLRNVIYLVDRREVAKVVGGDVPPDGREVSIANTIDGRTYLYRVTGAREHFINSDSHTSVRAMMGGVDPFDLVAGDVHVYLELIPDS